MATICINTPNGSNNWEGIELHGLINCTSKLIFNLSHMLYGQSKELHSHPISQILFSLLICSKGRNWHFFVIKPTGLNLGYTEHLFAISSIMYIGRKIKLWFHFHRFLLALRCLHVHSRVTTLFPGVIIWDTVPEHYKNWLKNYVYCSEE